MKKVGLARRRRGVGYELEAVLLRCAPVAHPGLHVCLSLDQCAIARVFSRYKRLRISDSPIGAISPDSSG